MQESWKSIPITTCTNSNCQWGVSTMKLLPLCVLVFLWCRGCTSKVIPQQPVIIDTDIGSYYDDTVAIAFAVQSSYLDVKLIVTCSDDTTARAKVTAKLLTLYGRDDIPIGIGVKNDNKTVHSLFDWAKAFNLSSYKGGVFEDGVEQMGEMILNSSLVVDLMAIGPATNFPALLSRFPAVTKNARIHAMGGSILKAFPEYNVKLCPYCWTQLLHAGWNVSIAPSDTASQATLTPPLLQSLLVSANDISLGIANSLIYFCIAHPFTSCEFKNSSATPPLFDTVAALLNLPVVNDYVVMKELNITVTEDGCTKVDNKTGVPVQVALYWQENQGLTRYKTYLTKVLAAKGQ